MVDVEVDRASMKFQLQTVNYVHFFIEAASIKSSKNLVQNQPTASSFLSHKSWVIQNKGTYAIIIRSDDMCQCLYTESVSTRLRNLKLVTSTIMQSAEGHGFA